MLSRTKLKRLRSLVPGEVATAHLDEAISCYQAGAYRMCTVMMANAVFGNLFSKITHLAGINGKFRKISDDAAYQRGAGNPFEQQLKQDLEKAKLILPEQVTYLEELRLSRNDFAHATDKSITASKAGYFLEEGVRLVLAEESFNAYTVIHEIEGRLRMPGFFPSAASASQLSVVREETAKVVAPAYHNLVRLVVDLLVDGDANTRRNASEFLRCCILLKIPALRSAVLQHLFVPRLGDHAGIDDPHTRAIWNIVNCAPTCVEALSDKQRQQFDRKIATLCHHLKDTKDDRWSPVKMFGRILKIAPWLLETVFKETSKSIVRQYPDAPQMLEAIETLGPARSLIVAAMRLRALSPSLCEAREFFDFADLNAKRIAASLDAGESYALLLSLERRPAPTSEGSLEALLRQKALDWFVKDHEAARCYARRNGLFDPAEYFQAGATAPSVAELPVPSAA